MTPGIPIAVKKGWPSFWDSPNRFGVVSNSFWTSIVALTHSNIFIDTTLITNIYPDWFYWPM
jgi:hypothetical protein